MPIDMPIALPDSLLSRLSDFLQLQMGLHFPRERWRDLARGIAAASRESGYPEAEAYIHWLLSAPLTRNQIEGLASHLTVGETYFFREKRSFEVLEQHILPELLHAREHTERRLRIWSAGCCTGEEPYSIAMLLDRLIPHSKEWNVTILATDINPAFLRKAAEGGYGEWSFRDTPAWVRERYFKRGKNARFEIQPSIRKRVAFSYLNLADDVYPSLTNNTNAMDVIFCRNVLMYFSAARAQKVIENLHRSLVDGGWLIVSPAETSTSLFSKFTAVGFPGAVLYRKLADTESSAVAAAYPAAYSSTIPNAVHLTVRGDPSTSLRTKGLVEPPATHPEPLDRALLSTVRSFDRLRTNGVEGLRTNGNFSYVNSIATAPGLLPEALPPAPPALVADAALTTPLHEVPSSMARDCANQGKLAEAAEWCEQAIAADKLNPANQYLLATIRQELGQNDAATQSLMRALYLDPDFVLAHFALGNLCLSQSRRREAERHFDNALALLHTHPHDEPLPESEGLTAGRLTEIITFVRSSLPRATVGA